MSPSRQSSPFAAWIAFALLLAILSTRCREPARAERIGQGGPIRGSIDKTFERANRLVTSRSQQQIQSYLRRHGMDSLQHDGQGLQYQIHGRALGPRPEEGVRVAIAYTLELLDGTVCDQADSIQPLIVSAGRRERTIALDQLLLRMAPGQRAFAIAPPHLAYGLVGHKGVPPNAPIIYRIQWMRYPKQ